MHNGLEQNEEMEVRLWAYIDGISEEASVVEKLIAENTEWKARYTELLEVHQMVQSIDLEEPSLRFTRNADCTGHQAIHQ